MELSSQEKVLLTKSFYQIVPISERVANMFYERLFESYPDVQPLFKKTEMRSQRKKLIDMIALVVYSVDNLSKVTEAIHRLGQRHVEYGVKKEDYAKVQEAFIWTLKQELGDDLSGEAEAVWQKVFDALGTMATENLAD